MSIYRGGENPYPTFLREKITSSEMAKKIKLAARKRRRKAYHLKPMSKVDVKTLARRIVTNEVFITTDPEEAQLAFGVLFTFFKGELPRNLGAIWESYDKAAPRAINGLPMFWSMHMIAKQDLPPLREQIKKMQKVLGVSK